MNGAHHGVELEGVTRRFGRSTAVADVSFDVRQGEVLGLLGPNGAGKTTTMRMITGADTVADPVVARRSIGYMPELPAAPPEMTVRSYLRFCARLRGVPRARLRPAVAGALGQAGLHDVGDQRIGTLSRGFRQRVALAQALVHDPPVLVLDEPTSGLDPRQVVETRELVTKLGRSRTVLLSSHLLSEVSQLCRRVVVLDHGKVLAVGDVASLSGGGTLEEAYLRLVRD